ncbi:MAG: hypothetical protein OES24_17410 [Acidimicrobiia bacterium]|nr:hypothetical protein [Acidimicrobiia bacterium]
MFSYFLPISLLVLAGFTLGLVVGWLTWVSSREPADQEPANQTTSEDPPEPATFLPDPLTDWSVIPDHVPDWSTLDLPVWRMREISQPGA